MSLLQQLMQNARRAEIGFGIHKNCVITEVSNDKRKTKEGEVINRNCYTKFELLDENGNSTAEKEISWYNIDPSADYAFNSFYSQLEQMTAIVDVLQPATGKKDVWSDVFDELMGEFEIELDAEDPEGSKAKLEEEMKDKDTFKGVMDGLIKAYVSIVGKKAGKDSTPMRLKIVFDTKGKYLQQPKFDTFVESMEVSDEDSRLKITKTDEEYRAKSLETTKKPTKNIGKL